MTTLFRSQLRASVTCVFEFSYEWTSRGLSDINHIQERSYYSGSHYCAPSPVLKAELKQGRDSSGVKHNLASALQYAMVS